MSRVFEKRLIASQFLLYASVLLNLAAQATNPPTTITTKAGETVSKSGVSTTPENKSQPYNPNALHRLDFKVVGKSCAVCLLNIQRRVKALPGVLRVAVQLKKPYAALIIYDCSRASQQKIFDKAKEGLKDVQFDQIEDTSIPKVPLILVPKIGPGE